ncbi:MAG TPA: hypothetical protein VF859_10380 [Burkholderiales bacterium]
MGEQRNVKCPAEIYGADLVSEVMTRIYPTQQACAAGHGCQRDDCALDGHWPEETASADDDDPDPARQCACRQAGLVSSWEFLGSD